MTDDLSFEFASSEQEVKIRLLTQLEDLPDPSLLDKLMVLVAMPRALRPTAVNAPLQRALAVVEWADSEVGCGLSCVVQALEQMGHSRTAEPRTNASGHDGRSRDADAALRDAETRLKELIKRNAPRREVERQRAEIAAIRRSRYEGAPAAAGSVLAGRYELLDLLGAGGFGAVWRAYHEQRQATVAVKILHPRFRADFTTQRRFRLGAQIMQELAREHKNIVQVLEPVQQWQGHEFFVMEYLARGSLETAVCNKTLTNDQLYAGLAQVGEALHFAHGRGIVHRDVGPGNILIHEDGAFRLADFDLSRAPLASIGSAAQIGRAEYMAPEVLYGGAKGDARSDLYSLAKTVQFAIWGQELPLAGKKDAVMFSVMLPCPAAVQQVLQKALADDPAHRHSSVQEFSQSLAVALQAVEYGTIELNDLSVESRGSDEPTDLTWTEDETPPASPRSNTAPSPGSWDLSIDEADGRFERHIRLVRSHDGPSVENPDYELLRLLGEGGQGRIYEARQWPLGRKVAVKMLRSRDRWNARERASRQQKFLAEAIVTANLQHPLHRSRVRFRRYSGRSSVLCDEAHDGRSLVPRLRPAFG